MEIIMRMKQLFIGSVAVCALAATLGAAPVLAQSSQSNNGAYGSARHSRQESTPAEVEATRALNQQGVNGSTVSPAVLNGTVQPAIAPQPSTPTSYSAPASTDSAPQGSNGPGSGGGSRYTPVSYVQTAQTDNQPSGAQQQYDEQSQQYQAQQQQYQDQRQNYEKERGNYYAKLRAYDEARYDWEYPHVVVYHYGDTYGLQRLYLIAEPSQQLANAPIEDPSGHWVGRVRNVDIGPDGRPARIEVALNRRVSVWVQPGDFRFDPDDHVLYTNLTREDLWDMPGATVESGPM
jgi:hypothetical protein